MAKERDELVAQLEEIAQYMEILGENDFKVRAYRKGAQAISASECALAEIASGAVKVAGVGEGLRGAVQEFLSLGAIAAREELAAKVPAGVLEIMRVPGLGAARAMAIHQELGVSSVAELEYACRENRLLTLKGFGKAMQEKVLHGIEQLAAIAGKFRLDEGIARAEAIEKDLRAYLGRSAEVLRVGALGRYAEVVERLEFYFTGSAANVAAAVGGLGWDGGLDELRVAPFRTELAGFSGRLRDGTELTLWVSERRSDERTLQWLCADRDVRELIAADPRRFDGWEHSWLESAWTDAGREPTAATYRIRRDGRVKGVFHNHTNFSDGAATLEQMVKGAQERGYEYIGISDHSQSAFYAQGLKPERIVEQRKLIEALQKKVSIRIFHGIESDILADGALDYEKSVLESFDFIVGSVHSRFKMEEKEMTGRLVRALENPHLTMWGHPTGRLLLGREGYALQWCECLRAAVKNGVAIEINANPARLDVDWRLGQELERHGASVCINPDAHEVDGLDDTVYGEYMAEKAMLPRDRILNRMNVAEMEKYLWERKKGR